MEGNVLFGTEDMMTYFIFNATDLVLASSIKSGCMEESGISISLANPVDSGFGYPKFLFKFEESVVLNHEFIL